MTDAPLADFTVLEFSDRVASRYSGRLFASLSARVLQTGAPSPVGVGYGGPASGFSGMFASLRGSIWRLGDRARRC